MRKVILQMLTTLDGYFEGLNQEIDWHNVDAEFEDHALELISQVDLMLFGRVTYEMMADFWPTEQARKEDPVMADVMNHFEKIVFSNTLNKAIWENSRLVTGDAADEVRRLKQLPGKNLVIFGSSDLAASLLSEGLIDELQIIVNPILLGEGKPLLKGIQRRQPLKLIAVRTFQNGNVLLTYQPAQKEA